jgi:hypothetical protein
MLDGAEPDLALAISMLRPVRANKEAHELWSKLTASFYDLYKPSDLPLAVHRLRSARPQFALRSLGVASELCLAPPLLSALTATTSLEHFITAAGYDWARLASALKEVKSLRVADLESFSVEAGLELLQSRTNWTQIVLDSKVAAGVTAFAPLNRSDFSLKVFDLNRAEHFRPWLLNPHLTELDLCVDTDIIPGVYERLQHCRNLALLVLSSLCQSLVFALSLIVRVQCVRADSELLLDGPSIPLSVARLELSRATPELLKHLIATRSSRALQSVKIFVIDKPETAALAAELVSTDPAKEWTYQSELEADAASAFCRAAVAVTGSGTRLSSLTDLRVITRGQWQPFAALFSATPSFRRFAVQESEVRCLWSLCVQTVTHPTLCVGRMTRSQSTARRFPSCLHRRCIRVTAFTRSTLTVVSRRTCI